jgi:hypothetical protein
MDDLQLRMLRWGQQGYSCAQILLLLALEVRGESNPGLVRAMAGLAYGCGSGRATCGALTGGCCLMSYLAAGDGAGDRPVERFPGMLQELSDWFEVRVGQTHGGSICESIVGPEGPARARQTCGLLVAETYGKALEILLANGVAP